MKGIMTNCNTGKESVVDLNYEIRTHAGVRYFQLINGVTGFESFYIDDYDGNVKENTLERMRKDGWRANMGTKGVWNELMISAEEMRKVLEGIE